MCENTQPLVQAKANIFRGMTVHTSPDFALTTRSVMVYAAGGAVSPTGWCVTAPTLRTPASLNTQRDRASASSMFPVRSCLTKTTTRRGVRQPQDTETEYFIKERVLCFIIALIHILLFVSWRMRVDLLPISRKYQLQIYPRRPLKKHFGQTLHTNHGCTNTRSTVVTVLHFTCVTTQLLNVIPECFFKHYVRLLSFYKSARWVTKNKACTNAQSCMFQKLNCIHPKTCKNKFKT